MTLQEARKQYAEEISREEQRHIKVMAEYENSVSRSLDSKLNDVVNAGLRKSSVNEYRAWLSGHLANGGKATHFYDYPFERWDFYTASKSASLSAQYGASSYCVIAPEGITITSGGHNHVYSMDGFTCDSSIVPMFSDV